MSLAPRISVLFLLVLSACAAPMTPPSPAVPHATTPQQQPTHMGAKLDALQESAARLRAQYEAMGETLKWQEGEIAALRQAALAQPAPVLEAHPEKSAETAKKETPADVGSLTEQDLQPIRLAPESAPDTARAASPATPALEAQNATTYYVHVASFTDQRAAAKGWAEFQRKNSHTFSNVSGVTTSFTDKKGKAWQRLWAGPYAAAREANATCAALKKKGSWCEVLPLAEHLVTKLP